MFKRASVAIIFLAVCAGAGALTRAKDAKDVVADVAKAMGTANLKSIQYSGTGFVFTFGQAYVAGGPWPKFVLKSYTRALDFENNGSEEKYVWAQAEEGEKGGGFVPLKGNLNQDAFVSGDVAWNGGANGAANPAPAIAQERQVRWAITPEGWVKAAMSADQLTMASKKINGKKMTEISFTWKEKYKINGYIDDQNMLARVETWLPQPILGDMPVVVNYSDYKDYGGVKFPGKIEQAEGGYPVLDLTVTEVLPNAPVSIKAPDNARTATVQPVKAESQQLAPGVWLIRAGIQSAAVEFKDFSVVVDGATNEERSNAVIAEVKRIIPNKPIKYVVNTHHHLDHAGGLRTFVAEGSTIVTGEGNKAYFEKVFKNPATIEPDRLAKNPKAPTFLTVKDKYVLTDGDQSIQLYGVPGNNHAPDIIVAYIPRAKVMVEADSFNPAAPARPGAPVANVTLIGEKQTLLDNIQRLKLDVQNFIPTHGNGLVPFSQLQKEIDAERDQLQKFASGN